MKKERLMYGASAAALALSGMVVPVNVMADEVVLEACTASFEGEVCTASTVDELKVGLQTAKTSMVKLASDIGFDATKTAVIRFYERTITLDLNGHHVTKPAGALFAVGDYSDPKNNRTAKTGEMTIIDSIGGGSLTSQKTVVELDGLGDTKLTVKGGDLTSVEGPTVSVFDASSVYVEGGSLTSNTREAIGGNNCEGDMNTYVTGGTLTSAGGYPTIYMPSQVNLKVSGDAVLNGSILVRMGQVEISGGTIHSAAREYTDIADGIEYSGLVALPGVINVLGGSYKSNNAKYGNSLNLSITGGSLISENSSKYGGNVVVYDLDKEAQEMNVNISGGTFTVKGAQAPVAVYDRDDLKLAPTENDIQNTTAVEVTGGTYNAEPSYVKPGYKAYAGNGGLYTVMPDGLSADGNDETDNDGEVADENSEILSSVADNILAELIANVTTLADGDVMTLGDGTKFVIDDADAVREALMAGEGISVDLVSRTDWTATEEDLANDKEGAKELMVMDYTVALYAGDVLVGRVPELPEDLTMSVDVSGAEDLAEDATREWTVTRNHEGKIEKIGYQYDNEEELLTFASRLFSTITISYLDTLKPVIEDDGNAPDTGMFTGDSVASRTGAGTVIVTVSAMVTAAIAMEIRAYKRRQG